MPPRSPATLRRLPLALLALGWVVLVALPPFGLARMRGAWIDQLSRPEVQRQWDTFRGEMQRQTGREGPVQRKVPRSEEPPQLVWLRDYFALACAAWVLFGSVLWAVTAFFVLGVGSLPENETGRHRHDEKQDDRDAENADQG